MHFVYRTAAALEAMRAHANLLKHDNQPVKLEGVPPLLPHTHCLLLQYDTLEAVCSPSSIWVAASTPDLAGTNFGVGGRSRNASVCVVLSVSGTTSVSSSRYTSVCSTTREQCHTRVNTRHIVTVCTAQHSTVHHACEWSYSG